MKKIISSMAMAICLLCGVNAHAEEQQSLRPYVGADVGVNVMPSDGGLTYSVNAGVRNGFFGLEVFYLGNNSENEKAIKLTTNNAAAASGIENAEFSKEMYSVGADLLAYLPIMEKFDLFAAVGYGMYFYEEEIDFADIGLNQESQDINYTETAHGIRLGAGAMYEFFPNLSARLMARYTIVEMGSYEKYANPLAVTLGLRYTF